MVIHSLCVFPCTYVLVSLVQCVSVFHILPYVKICLPCPYYHLGGGGIWQSYRDFYGSVLQIKSYALMKG